MSREKDSKGKHFDEFTEGQLITSLKDYFLHCQSSLNISQLNNRCKGIKLVADKF